MGVINRCRRKNFKKEKKKSSQIFESANSSRSRSQRRSNGGRRCEIKPNPNAIGFKQLRAATKEEKKTPFVGILGRAEATNTSLTRSILIEVFPAANESWSSGSSATAADTRDELNGAT